MWYALREQDGTVHSAFRGTRPTVPQGSSAVVVEVEALPAHEPGDPLVWSGGRIAVDTAARAQYARARQLEEQDQADTEKVRFTRMWTTTTSPQDKAAIAAEMQRRGYSAPQAGAGVR